MVSLAVQMNNEAVRLLDENTGNYKKAIARLGGALQKSKESMLYENDDIEESHKPSLSTLLGSWMNQHPTLISDSDDIDEEMKWIMSHGISFTEKASTYHVNHLLINFVYCCHSRLFSI